MKLLIDECVARPLVDALRKRFDDVIFVAEAAPRTPDRDVLAWAVREGRAVVTDDYEAIVIIAPGALGFDIHNDAENVATRILGRSNTLRGKLTIIERHRTRDRPL